MHGKLSGWDDTIAALATPQGIGAIGVIRVSGAASVNIVDSLFPSKNLAAQPSHTLHVGGLKYNGAMLDEVVVSLFKAPRSYTGEDVVEVSCHGSPYVQEQVLQALLNTGARPAKPGEFTLRAFLNGKLDLAQAEAVADLIASNTEASRKAALQNIRGGFSHVLKAIREELLTFSALIELELDFAQEDVEFADRGKLFQLLYNARQKVQQLLLSFKLGNVVKNGVQVAIIGKPNAGKSTLLNVLLNEERAIVSEIAGTTRDTIEEVLNINGILFRLIDTAGIRQHSTDVIETMGIEKSLEKMRNADIVVYLFDVNTATNEELEEIAADLSKKNIRFILVGNKADAGYQLQVTGYRLPVTGLSGNTDSITKSVSTTNVEQTGNQQPAPSNQHPVTSNQQPVTSNQQPVTSNQQPAPSNQQPAPSNQQPVTSNQQPVTSNQQPVTSNQQPATGNLLATSNQQPVTSPPIFISAKENWNIDALKEKLFNAAVQEQPLSQEALVTNTRHIAALEKVQASLHEIITGLTNKLPGDLLALDIKSCLHFLGEITGEITNEQQLDYIFSKFCIGK